MPTLGDMREGKSTDSIGHVGGIERQRGGRGSWGGGALAAPALGGGAGVWACFRGGRVAVKGRRGLVWRRDSGLGAAVGRQAVRPPALPSPRVAAAIYSTPTSGRFVYSAFFPCLRIPCHHQHPKRHEPKNLHHFCPLSLNIIPRHSRPPALATFPI
jgi:hypothetical protein